MSAAMMYQPATMTMAVPSNTVVETVAAPATYATGFAGTTAYAAAPTTFAAPATYAASTGFVGTQTYAAAPTYSTVAAPAVTTMAAPTYTTMAAAPTIVETIAAPQVTYAAAPQVTYAAPTVVETVAAAPVTYAAPMTTMAPSYAAPQMLQMMAPQMQMGPAPASLTEGIPTPDQITAQKTAYGAALEKQLKDGTDVIAKETEIEKNMVKFTADKQLAIMQLQIEEQRNEQLALLDEQATFRQCELRKAYVERKLQLDNQSSGYIMDYQMKAIQTELAQKQYQFQQTYMSAENKLAQDYNAQITQANTGTSYSVPAAAVPAPAPKAEKK